jgi:hypothetical protein
VSTDAVRPSGWYDDATDAALLRYWDGSGWTPHTAARHDPAVPDERTRALEPDLGLTARLRHLSSTPDHTTVPTLPVHPPAPTSGVLAGPDRMSPLPVLGAITAAASLVVAVAALGVALGD